MDGNGRWANAKGLSRVAGHKQGVNSVKALIKSCIQNKIPYLSIFAFSSENWNRPNSEVSALMELLSNALQTQIKKLNENGIKLLLIGDLSKFTPQIQKLANKAQAETQFNTKLVLAVAINYGGRWDITQACRQVAEKVASGEVEASSIDEDLVAQHLSTVGIPDPDLFIRTSGEYRLSNFFLWQGAYSEFYFVDTLWPDFNEQTFNDALIEYSHRDRRYGNARDKTSATDADLSNSQTRHSTQKTPISKNAVKNGVEQKERTSSDLSQRERV
jgi:undecaprenyl diphosphate synthase